MNITSSARHKKIFALLLTAIWLLSMPAVYASPNVSLPADLVVASKPYNPVMLKGVKIDPDNILNLEFILEENQNHYNNVELKKEGQKLIGYFLAALTIPEEDLWVNLSPYEKERIVPENLARTDVGKIMLEQDYLLKQLAASLTYPETEQGKAYWDMVQGRGLIHQTQNKGVMNHAPTNNFNKVWIIPEKAVVVEDGDEAVIRESSLGVKMERENEAFKKNILPMIEEDVNNGQNFASLRQVYNALILANWFKKKLHDSIFNTVYFDKSKTAGVENNDRQMKERIYAQYLEAFKKGAYDYVKTVGADLRVRPGTTPRSSPAINKITKRRYFSGGEDLTSTEKIQVTTSGDVEEAKSGINGPVSVKVELIVDSGAAVHRMNYAPVQGKFFSPVAVRKGTGGELSFSAAQIDIDGIKSKITAYDIAQYSDIDYSADNGSGSLEALIDDSVVVVADEDISAMISDILDDRGIAVKPGDDPFQKGLTILKVDKSPALAETHVNDGLILINRAVDNISHEGVRDIVELWLVYHGLCAIISGSSGADFEEEQSGRDAFYIINLCRSSGLTIDEFLENLRGVRAFKGGDIISRIERMLDRARVLSEETQDRVIEQLHIEFSSGRSFDAVLMGHAHADPFTRELLADVIAGKDKGISLRELADSFQGQVAMYRRDIRLIREASDKQHVVAIGVELSSQALEQIGRSYKTDIWAIEQRLRQEGVSDIKTTADDIFLYLYGPVIYLKLTDKVFSNTVKLFAMDDKVLSVENHKSFNRCHGKLMIFIAQAQSARIGETALRDFQIFINAGNIFDRKATALALSVFDGDEKIKKMARQLTGLMRKFRRWSRTRSEYMADKILRTGQLYGEDGAVMAVCGKVHFDDVKAILTGDVDTSETPKPPKSSRKSSSKMRAAEPVDEDTGGVDWRGDDFVSVESKGNTAKFSNTAIDPATFKGFTFKILSIER